MKSMHSNKVRWTRFLSAILCFAMLFGAFATPKASAAAAKNNTLVPGEAYYIKETATGRYLTVNSGEDYNFNPVGVNPLVSKASQRWIPTVHTMGGYQFKPECTASRILDVSYGQTDIYLNKGFKDYNSFVIEGNPFTGCKIKNKGLYLCAESGKATKWSYVKVSSAAASTWIFEPVNPAIAVEEYEVTFYDEDTSPVCVELHYILGGKFERISMTIPYGECLDENSLPVYTDKGYKAAGWYVDSSFKEKYDFSERMTECTKLFLKSELDRTEKIPYSGSRNLFYDTYINDSCAPDGLMEIWETSTEKERVYMTSQDSFLYWALYQSGRTIMRIAHLQVELFEILRDYATMSNYAETVINYNNRHTQVIEKVDAFLCEHNMSNLEFPTDLVLREIYDCNVNGKIKDPIGGLTKYFITKGNYGDAYYNIYNLYTGYEGYRYYPGMTSAEKVSFAATLAELDENQLVYFFRDDDMLGSVICKYFDFHTSDKANTTAQYANKRHFYMAKADLILKLKDFYYRENMDEEYSDDGAWNAYCNSIRSFSNVAIDDSDYDMMRVICSQLFLETKENPIITTTEFTIDTANEMLGTMINDACNYFKSNMRLTPEIEEAKALRSEVMKQIDYLRLILGMIEDDEERFEKSIDAVEEQCDQYYGWAK